MADKPLTHPEKDDLVAFGLGKLTPDEVSKIESHLDQCQACCETLLDLKDDTFVELVRTSPTPDKSKNQTVNDAEPAEKEAKVGEATDEAISAATILVDSPGVNASADLPPQLLNHARYDVLMGNGKAVFDDLELLALSPEHLVLDRLVGEWDIVHRITPADGKPATEVRGVMRARWALGGTCMLSELADENGDVTELWLADRPSHAESYRHWSFGADGTASYRETSWNEPTRSLATDATSDNRVVVTQFTGAEAFKMRVLRRGAPGETTVESEETATRYKGPPLKFKLVTSGPATDPTELSVLDRFVGDWNLEFTAKPSFWHPDGDSQTGLRNLAQWILNGRYIMEQGSDAESKPTAMTLWTYDKNVKQWLGWNFLPSGHHARMSGTWIADTNTLAIEVTDAPEGTTGKGTIRFVGSDTIDATLVFKGSDGAVLMDGRWFKKRRGAAKRAGPETDSTDN